MSLVEDLSVAHEEGGLLHSTLEHAVDGLDLAGGLTLLLGPDGELLKAAEHHFAPGMPPAVPTRLSETTASFSLSQLLPSLTYWRNS